MSVLTVLIITACLVFLVTAVLMYAALRILTYFDLFPGPESWTKRVKK